MRTQKFGTEKPNLKNLRKAEVKENYKFQVSKRYAVFEVLDDGGDQTRVWEMLGTT
jgi:hypothetical protein